MSGAVLVVVGARPNFVKTAPVLRALRTKPAIELRILHTGQHYDRALSEAFSEQLGFPSIDYHLGVGAGTHAEQTAGVLIGVERVLSSDSFDAVIVSGDVNSTLGAALAASKLDVPIVHIESGLRSGDWTMPEEINRVLVDRVSSLLLCHCDEAIANLAAEGIAGNHVVLAGNTMIDSLFDLLPSVDADGVLAELRLEPLSYVLVTLHRPSLVDNPTRLSATLQVLDDIAGTLPVVLPLHPRTRQRLSGGSTPEQSNVRFMEPVDYRTFIALESSARLVITDSGGVQEETSALGVPCLTYRSTTEREVTIRRGSNRLVGIDPRALRNACVEELGDPHPKRYPPIPLWDGSAGARAANAIAAFLSETPKRPYQESAKG